MFAGHRVTDKLVLADLVLREQGNTGLGVDGGFIDLQNDRDAIVGPGFDVASPNG